VGQSFCGHLEVSGVCSGSPLNSYEIGNHFLEDEGLPRVSRCLMGRDEACKEEIRLWY